LKKKNGGVGIYVRNDITCKILTPHPDGHSDFTEILWFECCCGDVDYYIAGCYHPPHVRYPDSVLKSELTRDLEMLICNSKLAVNVVAGDFNSFDSDFLEYDFGLVQLVKTPTRGNNILDKFFTSHLDVSQVEMFSSLIMTKHQVVYVKQSVTLNFPANSCSCKKFSAYHLRPHHLNVLRYYIGINDWRSMLSCEELQSAYDEFLTTVKYYIQICIPVKTVCLGKRDPEFVTPFIKVLLNKRNKLRRQGDFAAANNLARRINFIIADTLCGRLSRLVHAPVKDMWNAINFKSAAREYNGRTRHLLSDVERVNEFFARLSFDPLCKVERKATKTAPGRDNIPYWLFRHCSYELAEIVAHIFNCTLQSGTVPSQWLTAVITPVPKISAPSTLSDFRPISVTPILMSNC
jgi:hypothetical protein